MAMAGFQRGCTKGKWPGVGSTITKEQPNMQSRWLARSASAVALVAVMATGTLNPASAHAGVPGVFATEYTQLLNYAELAAQLEKQAMMVENQLTQIADMAKN